MTAAAHATPLESWNPPARGVVLVALVAGAALLVLTLVLGLAAPTWFSLFPAYLFAFLFWWMVSMGCLGLALLHNLTGGRWGDAIRPFLHAGMATILLAAVLFIPVALMLLAPSAFRLEETYEWASPHAAEDPILEQKLAYLNTPFFLVRAVAYFVIWLVAAAVARSGARRASAVSLAFVILAVSFAAVDWAMSLEPHWFSTMYGALYVAGAAVAAMALSVVFLASLAPSRAAEDRRAADVLNDLGNLLLAFVMVWAYFSFSQFLIIWSGDLPEENKWYIRRGEHGWEWVATAIAALHFAAPFLLLLSRDIKRNPRLILSVAIGLLVMRSIDLFWVVIPAFHDHGWLSILLDFAALLGVGGIWLAAFCWKLKPPSDHKSRRRGKH